jgi:cyclic pyranopterin phosphate synthase
MLSASGVKLDWHLRFGVTSRCNFRCVYCNPTGIAEKHDDLSTSEVLSIVQAAYNCGVRRVHWTGGEPTLRHDFENLVAESHLIGMTEQVVTTNGYRIHKNLNWLADHGLTRVIISFDTLCGERNKWITGADYFSATMATIEASAKRLEVVTKVNIATLKSTLPEIGDFISYAQKINSQGYPGYIAFKLIEFCPSNPAQLQVAGQELFKQEWLTEQDIISALEQFGSLQPYNEGLIPGDNPSTKYYSIGDTGVIFGILAMPSWNFPCGHCKKIRITPFGRISVCLNIPKTEDLKGLGVDEKTAVMTSLMTERENLDLTMPNRHHYRAQLGEMRFGKTGEPVAMEVFQAMRGRQT